MSHSRYCYHCSCAFYGSYNYITIAKNDEFIVDLLSRKYSKFPYILYDDYMHSQVQDQKNNGVSGGNQFEKMLKVFSGY